MAGPCDWTNCVIPQLEFNTTSLSNVVLQLNKVLSRVSQTVEAERLEIVWATNTPVAGCISCMTNNCENLLSMDVSGMSFGEALPIIGDSLGVSFVITEHGAVLDRDKSHDWETQCDSTMSNDEVDGVAEAVFRYMCEHVPASIRSGTGRTPCFELFGNDPSPEFLERFAGFNPPVKQGSIFSIGTDLLFHVKGCRRISESSVEVIGLCFSDAFSFADSMFTLIKRDGKWVVIAEECLGIG